MRTHRVTTTYDFTNRISRLSGQKAGENAIDYWNNLGYEAHGAVRDRQLGTGLWEQNRYNERLQTKQLGLGETTTINSTLTTTQANHLLLGLVCG